MGRRYFEDFAVGDTWISPEFTMTEDDMLDFARKYDPQPMHIDPEAAANGPHGSIIASGWQIAAISLKLFVEAGGYGGTSVLGLGSDEWRWPRVVRPGDRLTVRREVVELRRSKSNPKKGLIRTRITVANQAGDTVMSMVSTGMVESRSDDQGMARPDGNIPPTDQAR